jgi:DNA-binding transcriptional LysR family regulator
MCLESPTMDIQDLIYLAASADVGNLSRAARILGINTSSISRRIGRLEDELGVTLFDRTSVGVRLTPGGRDVMCHVRRALAELDAVRRSGFHNGSGDIGEVRLGVRIPPVGEPLRGLLDRWRKRHPDIRLSVAEMNDRDLAAGLEAGRLDVALTMSYAVWPLAVSMPLYQAPLVAVLPLGHRLAKYPGIAWTDLRRETILVQGWDQSQAAREFYASFVGSGARFQSHAASQQCVFALVGAGFGVTIAATGHSQVAVPGVIFRPIDEPTAFEQVDLAWLPAREDPAVGRFVAFMRDEARSGLL